MPGSSDPSRGRGRGRWWALIALAGLLVASAFTALALAAGDDSEDRTAGQFEVADDVKAVGELRAGSVAQIANCEDWNAGAVEERKATVVDIREQLTSGGTAEGTPNLSDQDAYDVFERACANDFTSAFQLYKIYFRANAFSGYDPYQYAP